MREKETARRVRLFDEEFLSHAHRIAIIVFLALIWAAFPFRPQPSVVTTAAVDTVTPVVSRGIPDQLAERSLLMPVRGVSISRLSDSFHDRRGKGREHEAIDIMADLRTPVVAIENGTVARLENSALGGISVYQFDPTGQYVYYYAHLSKYTSGLAEGQVLHQGDVIGYVGETGNAQTPHLHFAISRLGPDRKWWRGEPLDPYPILLGARPS